MLVARTAEEAVIVALKDQAPLEALRLRGPQFHYLVRAPAESCWTRGDGRTAALAGHLVVDGGGQRLSPTASAAKALSDPDYLRLTSDIAGDFCAAVVDPGHDRLVLIASRVGLPPLYCFRPDAMGTLLASEDLDVLLDVARSLGYRLVLDRAYVGWYLTGLPDNALATTPSPTAYRQITTVPPGTFITSDSFDRATRHWVYWDGPEIPKRLAADRIRNTFLQAVADRTDPGRTGVLLSGGLDSSAVACGVTHATRGTTLYCYTNIFDEIRTADERLYAEAIVRRLGACGRFLPADGQWALQGVPDPLRRPQPEPYQGWFYAQDRSVAQAAHADDVTTILDGIGGDELFTVSLTGGRFNPDQTNGTTHQAARIRVCSKVGRSALAKPEINPVIVPQFAAEAFVKDVDLHDRIRQPLVDLANATTDPVTMHRLFSCHFMGNAVADCVWAGREIFTPNMIVNGHPLLDHRLIELVFGIPVSVLITPPALGKALLRAAVGDLLPQVVARRKHGMDYTVVLHRGFAAEGERLLSMMDDPLVYQLGFVDADTFAPCLRDLIAGTGLRALAEPFHDMQMWQVITLEIWLRDQARRGGLVL